MFSKKQAVVRTKKYGKLVRLCIILAVVSLTAGLIAYGWQKHEEQKYPEGTEMDYSLPNAFIDFARLVSDFINQNKEETPGITDKTEISTDEEDNIIIVGSNDEEKQNGEEAITEPEIRGGIVPESENYNTFAFADSLFVGDYFVYQAKNLGYFAQADFASVTGLDMNTMLTKKVFKYEDKNITLSDYVGTFENVKAVYIMISAESISWMDYPTFVKKYTAFIDDILESQPEAHIYIQPILPINEEKAKKRSYSVTNEKIESINEYIFEMAEEKNIWILDMIGAFSDENGELPAEFTTNGIRFEKDTYEIWEEYICNHRAH